jgi:ribosomal protein S18 acetylase RimI-like enzyme
MKYSTEIILRNWTKEDFQTVRNILLVTWKDAYHFIPEKDIITHLENYYSEAKLLELFNNHLVRGILAEIESRPIGWMKLYNDELVEKFFISSLYVLPEFQGYGIGKKLLQKAEETAKKLKHDKVWLGVMKDNVKALEWYRKIGFQFIEEEPFKMGETEVMHLIGNKLINHSYSHS